MHVNSGLPSRERTRFPARVRLLLNELSLRRLALALFVILAAVSTVQRGVLSHTHATFPIFRQSFVHLEQGRDLYARYPTEQGAEERDRFKYNPSSALAFAPFSVLPFLAGLLAWTLVNALGVYAAVRRLFPGREATWALFIVFPALIAAVQSTSSNGLVAALFVGAFLSLEARQNWRGAAAIAAGTLMKLFPAALLPFALIRPDRRRLLGIIAVVFAVMLAAPLMVTTPADLVAQYRSWLSILLADERDLSFARSIMVVFRNWNGTELPNWLFQAVATMIVVTPLALRPSMWNDARFRRSMLASLLIFVVIFNHQSENASYVIASVGLAIWFLSAEVTAARVILLVACMAGLEAVPYFLVWLWMQFDLLDGERLVSWARGRIAVRLSRPASNELVPSSEAVEA